MSHNLAVLFAAAWVWMVTTVTVFGIVELVRGCHGTDSSAQYIRPSVTDMSAAALNELNAAFARLLHAHPAMSCATMTIEHGDNGIVLRCEAHKTITDSHGDSHGGP